MLLCSCLHDPCAPSRQASHEERERVLLLRFLVNNLDDLRRRLGEDWNTFAHELHHRILPVMRAHNDVSVLRSLADAIKEQVLTWPGEQARVLKEMAAHAARDAAGLVLPKRWREKQELMNLFQQMYLKLERGREEPISKDLEAESCDGKQMKCCINIVHANSRNRFQ